MKNMYVAGAYMTSLCRKRPYTNNKQTITLLTSRRHTEYCVQEKAVVTYTHPGCA